MSITLNEIDKLAKLAKLEFSTEEKEKLAGQFQQIFSYVEKLDDLNVDGVVPTCHVLDLKNVFREDEVKASLPRDQALKNAPVNRDGFFSVPKVIKK